MSDALSTCRSRADLILLLDMQGPGTELVEVGCAEGRFSVELLQGASRAICHFVDPWLQQPLGEWMDGGNRHQTLMDAEYADFLQRTEPYADRRRVIRDFSLQAAARFNDRSLDLVYIDANHGYEAVRADLAAWWPKVRPGGILAGHDYSYNPDMHVLGVIPAVLEFAKLQRMNPYLLVADSDDSWAFRKPL